MNENIPGLVRDIFVSGPLSGVGDVLFPAEKIYEKAHENEKDKGLAAHQNLARIGNRMDIAVAQRGRGHKAVVEVVDSGPGLGIEQVQAGINQPEVECNLNVIEQQQQDGPVGRPGMGKHICHKNQGSYVQEGLEKKIDGQKKKHRRMGHLVVKDQQRKAHLEDDVEFDGQVPVGKAIPAEGMPDVNTGENKLHEDEEEPDEALQSDIVVPVVVPDPAEVFPVFAQDGFIAEQVVLGFAEK